MQSRNAKQIIDRYLSKTCTDEERAWVEDWYNQQSAKSSGKSFSDEGLKLSALRMWPAILPKEILSEEIHREIQPREIYAIPKIRKLWLAAIAAAILIFGIGSLIWMNQFGSGLNFGSNDSAELIVAGGNRATLTLADGRIIDLSDDQNGIVVGDEDIKYNDGSDVIPSERNGVEGSVRLHSSSQTLAVTTPKGSQYQIILPDGTKVWLNASTTLKYPSKFNNTERIIELEGEAYFDVATSYLSSSAQAKDFKKIPFIVKTKGQTVEVLGTQFNITAYSDELNTKTTLVEGSVKVFALSPNLPSASSLSSRGTNDPSKPSLPSLLSPGQQSIIPAGTNNIQVNSVDINPYIAWTKGEFIFKATPLKEVFHQLARWYDIDVDYSTIPDEKIHGIIKRDKPLSSILKTIEKTSGLKFIVKERRVILEK